MKHLVLIMICTVYMLGLTAGGTAAAQDAATGIPDEAAMEKMIELGKPAGEHQVLDPLEGEWDLTVIHKMGPDAPTETSTGKSENRWVLGERFMQQKVTGTMDIGGETYPFEGIGFIGYDNIKKEYITTWVDNMSTGIMTTTGKYDPSTKTIRESGRFSCPMRGREVEFTGELKFIDNNHFTYTMYDTAPEGQQYKAMEIHYMRAARPS